MFLDRSWPIRGGAADIYMPLGPVNGAPFSYRNRTPHLYDFFLLRFVIWLLRHINIGSSAPDWPGTVQKHSDTSTTLKKRREYGRFCLEV